MEKHNEKTRSIEEDIRITYTAGGVSCNAEQKKLQKTTFCMNTFILSKQSRNCGASSTRGSRRGFWGVGYVLVSIWGTKWMYVLLENPLTCELNSWCTFSMLCFHKTFTLTKKAITSYNNGRVKEYNKQQNIQFSKEVVTLA